MMQTNFPIKPSRLRSLILDAYKIYQKKEYHVVTYIVGIESTIKPFSFQFRTKNKWYSLQHFDSEESLAYFLDDFLLHPTGVYIERSSDDDFHVKKFSLLLEEKEYVRHFLVNDTLFIETKECGLFSINLLDHSKEKTLDECS